MGSQSPSHVRTLGRRQGWLCFYCNCRLIKPGRNNYGRNNIATIDHRTPLCRGGSGELWNKCLACAECNSRKGALTVEEYLSVVGEPAKLLMMKKAIEAQVRDRRAPPEEGPIDWDRYGWAV